MYCHGDWVARDKWGDSVMALQDLDEGFVEEETKARSEGMAPPLGLPAHFALEGTAEHSIVSSLLISRISFLSGLHHEQPPHASPRIWAFCQASWMTYLIPCMVQQPKSRSDLGTLLPHECCHRMATGGGLHADTSVLQHIIHLGCCHLSALWRHTP